MDGDDGSAAGPPNPEPQPHALPARDLAGSDAEDMEHDESSDSENSEDAEAQHQDDADEDRDFRFGRARAPRARGRVQHEDEQWGLDRIHLRDFLRLFAVAGGAHPQRPFGSNEELVQHLLDGNVIRGGRVQKAMLACPREVFVPAAHRNEAYVDNPIRVEAMQFNISAPHMHASAVEALEIQPGERLLDVGCGSGAVTALAAFLTGRAGEVVGVDIKRECIELCEASVKSLREAGSDFSATAGPIRFKRQNIFLNLSKHAGQYDKVHVGATCPEQHLPSLMAFLKPEGGKIIVPVDSDLRLLTKKGDKITHEVLLQVRFSELEVPSDAEILMATLHEEVKRQRDVLVPPSTFSQDLQLLAAATPMAEDGSSSTSSHATNYEQEWGPADCTFTAQDFHIPAHKAVLRARCEHFRAKFSSGMKDADECELQVPDSFRQDVFHAFMRYIYEDTPPQQLDLDSEQALHLLHIATYYGASRLVVLCEAQLAAELVEAEHSTACEFAPGLLAVADENGLQQLKSVALSFIAENYDAVSTTEGYSSLSRPQVDLVARACFDRTRYLYSLLSDLSNKPTLPPPPSRALGW